MKNNPKIGDTCRLVSCHEDRRWTKIKYVSRNGSGVAFEEQRGGYYYWDIEDIEIKMKMKAKPKKPTNPSIRSEHNIDYWQLSDVIKIVEGYGVDLSAATIETDNDYQADDYAIVTFNKPKYTDEEYIEELKKYEKKLIEYNKWCDENREEIEAKLKEKELAELKKKENEKKRLEKQMAEIEKKIKKLEK